MNAGEGLGDQGATVSVVMATYNAMPFLSFAIASILKQHFTRFELIIVDDGSTDQTLILLDQWRGTEPRVRIIRQTNQGVGAATNTGIRAARGDYIAIMDADDIAIPERLALQAAFLDANPEVAGVGGQWLMIDVDGGVLGLDFQPTDPDVLNQCGYAFYALHHPTTMVRRVALETVGLYEEDRGCLAPDYDVLMRMQAAGFRFANLPKILLHWRQNPAGLTRSKALPQTASSHAIRQRGFQMLRSADPVRARQVARNLLMTFPEGTWFDQKLRSLLPEENRSYLLRAMTETDATPSTPDFTALEARILDWFEGQQDVTQPLATALRENGHVWLATHLEIRGGLRPALAAPEFYPIAAPATATCRLSVLLQVDSNQADLSDRLENVRGCVPEAEILLYSEASEQVSTNLDQVPALGAPSGADAPPPLSVALARSTGALIAYLEPYHRWDRQGIQDALALLEAQRGVLCYVPVECEYLEVLDEGGSPCRDPAPQPRWTRQTLLGRNRVVLSGFCHRRELIESAPVPLGELGSAGSRALAWMLAHRRELRVIDHRHRELVPPLSFQNRIFPRFQERMLNWYFDSGLGSVPIQDTWGCLSADQIALISARLNQAWRCGEFCVHPGNLSTVLDFFVRKVSWLPRFKVFRDLSRRFPRPTDEALLHQRRIWEYAFWTLDRFGARVICRLTRLLPSFALSRMHRHEDFARLPRQ